MGVSIGAEAWSPQNGTELADARKGSEALRALSSTHKRIVILHMTHISLSLTAGFTAAFLRVPFIVL
jgi:hypothetical protein